MLRRIFIALTKTIDLFDFVSINRCARIGYSIGYVGFDANNQACVVKLLSDEWWTILHAALKNANFKSTTGEIILLYNSY